MKFKYNPSEKKLWRIKDDYLYEVSEESRSIEHFFRRGTRISFQLGDNHWLILNPNDEFNSQMTACYTKPLKNGELTYYEKKITLGFFKLETIFEFTETDQVKKGTS